MDDTSHPFAASLTEQNTLDGSFRRLLEPILETLVRIEARLSDTAELSLREVRDELQEERIPLPADFANDESAVVGTSDDRLCRLEKYLAGLAQKLTILQEQLTERLPLHPDESVDPAGGWTSSDASVWEQVILGEDICQDAKLDDLRKTFLEDVIAGDGPARALAGYFMLVRAAAVNEIPELLKHVGEAYYRWSPRTSAAEDPMEKTVVKWLNRLVEHAGLPNSIQPVRFGERFDSSRHVADERGVEIVSVRGWVVLRDNNRVYTKARVSVA
ncbi:MAG: hypothetical protein ACC628_16800 [Pirellulaceae bacterium]